MESTAFVESLKELMLDYKIGVNQLAEKIQCDKAAIRRWLYGMYLPDPETIFKIADTFQISADYLFGLSDRKDYIRQPQSTTFYERYAKLRDLRKDSDYTVSKECAIRDSAISKWKTIKKFPTTVSLLKLSAYFHCSLDYLLGRSSN